MIFCSNGRTWRDLGEEAWKHFSCCNNLSFVFVNMDYFIETLSSFWCFISSLFSLEFWPYLTNFFYMCVSPLSSNFQRWSNLQFWAVQCRSTWPVLLIGHIISMLLMDQTIELWVLSCSTLFLVVTLFNL